MVRVVLFGFCDWFCGFFRVLSGFQRGSFFTPLLNFLKGTHVDFSLSGLFFDPRRSDSGDFLKSMCGVDLDLGDIPVKPFSSDVLREEIVEGDVGVVNFDSFSINDLEFLLNFLLDNHFNVILLGGNEVLLDKFTEFFEERGRILVGGEFFGYLDDSSLALILLHLLNLMGLNVVDAHLVRFADFKSVKFCKGNIDRMEKPVHKSLKVVSVPRRIKKGYVLSKFFADFSFLDSEFSISLNCFGDEFLSLGSKLFDLILAIHCYSKMGIAGAPSELKVYGFKNYFDEEFSYVDALKSVFNNVKRCFSNDQ